VYELEQGEKIYTALKTRIPRKTDFFEHERAEKTAFTYNSKFLLFTNLLLLGKTVSD
jgi:hypothetical protein